MKCLGEFSRDEEWLDQGYGGGVAAEAMILPGLKN